MSRNYVSNKDETVRMFQNDLLEKLSRVHWTVPLYVYIPVIFFFLYRTVAVLELELSSIILLFILGLFIWTLTEYLLHRFVFHFNAKSEFGKKIHFMFHGVHHDYPNDSRRLVMPPAVSIPLALLFYFLFYFILGEDKLGAFFAGFLTGYLFYDITHYAIHHFNMKSSFWLKIKNHHMIHHYKDPNNGFGVSQPMWDHVFKTTFPVKEKA